MTPTTKAAMDAAERAIGEAGDLPLGSVLIELFSSALRLIAEARKAEESDTARLDWLTEHEKPTMVDGSPDGLASVVVHHLDLGLREAIDVLMLLAPPEGK